MPYSEEQSAHQAPLVVVDSRRSENIVLRGAQIRFDEMDEDSPTHIKRLDTDISDVNVRRLTTNVKRVGTQLENVEEQQDVEASLRTDTDWNQSLWDRRQSVQKQVPDLRQADLADLAISVIVDEEKEMMTEQIKKLCRENTDIINQKEFL